jgi:hypothetical protein
MKNLTRILAVTAFVGGTMLSTSAMALDANIDATVDFLPAITLTQNQIIDFGTVEFTGAANDTVSVGTDDVVVYGGATMTGDTVGVAGEMAIGAGTGATVDVSCDDTGAQVGDGVNTLNLQNTEIIMGTANGVAFGGAVDLVCAGLGTTPVAHVMTGVAADDTILVGSQIDTSSGTVTTNTYTSTLSGNFIQIRALYQ